MTSIAVMKRFIRSAYKQNPNQALKSLNTALDNFKELSKEEQTIVNGAVKKAYEALQAKGVKVSKTASKSKSSSQGKSSSKETNLRAILRNFKEKVGAERYRSATRGTDIPKDMERPALKRGKRATAKKGYTSNQFGTFKNKIGKVYYESRANRMDVNQPSRYRTPKLAHGGQIMVGDIVNLPEIKMRDGKTQFERVSNGKIISIEDGIYEVLNPQTNRIHRVSKEQIEEVSKDAKGGGVNSKMSYDDFVETLQEYEIEGGYGKSMEKGYRMYYLPKDNPYLNTKFPYQNKKKAYEVYLKLEKGAKGGKVMYAKGGGVSRSQKQYNKMVDEYKYFVVDLEKKRALSGWEYKEDANDELSHYDGDKNFKVVAERTLSSMGIENPKDRFKKSTYDGGKTMYANGGKVNLSFNYNPSNISNEEVVKIVKPYTNNYRHNNDFDEVSFFVMGLTKEKANALKTELNMEDTYNLEIDSSRYDDGGEMMYAEGGETNAKYLDSLSESKRNAILNNIAEHYAISVEEAEDEVKDSEAEMLYEYIANDNDLRMIVYKDMQKGYAKNEMTEYAKGGQAKMKFKKGDKVVGSFKYEYGQGLQIVSNLDLSNTEQVKGVISNEKNIDKTTMYYIRFDNGEELSFPDFAINHFIRKSSYANGGMMKYAQGGVFEHGLQKGDKIVEVVENEYLVVESDSGVMSVVDIEKGSRFILGLDDSKTSGSRKDMGEVGLNDAMEYINYVKKQKMAQGGFVGSGAGADMTPTMMGGGMGNVQDAIMADGGKVGDKVQLLQGLKTEHIFRNFPEGEYEIKKIIKGNDTSPEGFYEIENQDGRRTQFKKSRFALVSSKGFMADGGEVTEMERSQARKSNLKLSL
jgi:hypothetical protein